MTAYYPSPLGVLKIVATDDAIAAIVFTEEGAEAAASETSPVLQQCITQLDEYFSGTRRTFDFPIGQAGTAFQQKVWEGLLAIPYGRTVSYLALSKTLGDAKAIRAVGTANGRNNLAIVVPCHRVIGSNQSLTGYAGGLWRKQWLLEHEAKVANGVRVLF
ncbi:MAG: methylated-DNA--[protein]-cysteine S-methyltransferase [Flaviaesturariibacter sp.]|nr:methylated-DNA--[protein]-cysteine S-methyltransferase [Flaviaesturariibacter sp.]